METWGQEDSHTEVNVCKALCVYCVRSAFVYGV